MCTRCDSFFLNNSPCCCDENKKVIHIHNYCRCKNHQNKRYISLSQMLYNTNLSFPYELTYKFIFLYFARKSPEAFPASLLRLRRILQHPFFFIFDSPETSSTAFLFLRLLFFVLSLRLDDSFDCMIG